MLLKRQEGSNMRDKPQSFPFPWCGNPGDQWAISLSFINAHLVLGEKLVSGSPFLAVFKLDSVVQESQVDQKQSCLKSKAVTNTSHSWLLSWAFPARLLQIPFSSLLCNTVSAVRAENWWQTWSLSLILHCWLQRSYRKSYYCSEACVEVLSLAAGMKSC